MAKPECSPGYVRLLCKEYVSLFQFGNDIGMLLDVLVLNAFAVNHLNHANEATRQALKSDYCVARVHVVLKLIRYHSTLHIHSLRFRSLRVCVVPHMGHDPGGQSAHKVAFGNLEFAGTLPQTPFRKRVAFVDVVSSGGTCEPLDIDSAA
jgi:hypothetical protein